MGMIMKDGIPYGGIYPIDDAPTQGSNNAVKSGGVFSSLSNKVDKVAGKGLSTNDYTDDEKGKVADNTSAIEAMVNVNGCCNVLDLSDPSIVSDGVTFTVNSDGSVTANGTAVTNSFIVFKNAATARDMVVVGASDGVHIIAQPYGHSWEIVDEGIIHGINQNGFALQVDAGVTVNNVTVYPMLYDARLNPTGYVPYAMTNRELTERVTPEQSVQLTMNSNVISSGSCKYTKIGRLVFVNAEYTPSTVANEGVITTGLPPAINGNCSVWDGFAQTLVQNVSDGTARWCFWFPTRTDLDRRQISFMYISKN